MTMANSHLEGSPSDLNAHDSRKVSKIDGIKRSLKCNVDSKTAVCVHERSSKRLRGGGDGAVDALTINDVKPIKIARERFVEVVVNSFTARALPLVVELPDSEVRYIGDPRYASPLIYVENIYETLVNEVDARLASLAGFVGETIGLDLEALGGLYKELARVFPEEGFFTFERRELATLADTRKWFPELVVQEEKVVPFVVIDGLNIIEKRDSLSAQDAEWFKRLTGRSEVSISAQDYKFYPPGLKYQHEVSIPLPSIPDLPKKKISSSKGKTTTKTPPLGNSAAPSSSPAKSMESKANVKPPNIISKKTSEPYVEEPYLREIPSFMVPYIIDFYDEFAYGHSGFNAIAEEVGFHESGGNGWRGVRRDLFLQLVTESHLYAELFTSETVKKLLKALSVWTIPADLPEQQLSIPDMGHIVATHYQVAFVVLGQHCVTFLPLCVAGTGSDIPVICLVYLHHQKRFISVTLDEGFSSHLPPIHPLWYRHHDSSADGLDHRFADRIQQFEWFQSFMDPPLLEKCD